MTTGRDAAVSGSARTSEGSPAEATSRGGYLRALNPVAKLGAPLPVMVALVFTRGTTVPLVFTALAIVLLLVGARLPARVSAALLVATPIGIAVLAFTLGLWVDPARVDASAAASVTLLELGGWRYSLGAYLIGLATALRFAALLMLSLIVGLTTTGSELVRAIVQNLRVPYRVGYTALAALRFVPRFRHELETIRAAHRVRGTDRGRGPVAALRRSLSYAIPLLASAIRHAERVALAMDARAFGAHPARTERTPSPWRARDTAFVVLFWAASVAVFAWAMPSGLTAS